MSWHHLSMWEDNAKTVSRKTAVITGTVPSTLLVVRPIPRIKSKQENVRLENGGRDQMPMKQQ